MKTRRTYNRSIRTTQSVHRPIKSQIWIRVVGSKCRALSCDRQIEATSGKSSLENGLAIPQKQTRTRRSWNACLHIHVLTNPLQDVYSWTLRIWSSSYRAMIVSKRLISPHVKVFSYSLLYIRARGDRVLMRIVLSREDHTSCVCGTRTISLMRLVN